MAILTTEQIENKNDLIIEMEEYLESEVFEDIDAEMLNAISVEDFVDFAKSELDFFKKDDTASVEMLFEATQDFPILNIIYSLVVNGFSLDLL
jgi:hypothetical protein